MNRYDGSSKDYRGARLPPDSDDWDEEDGQAAANAAVVAKPTSSNTPLSIPAGLTARPASPQSITRWQGDKPSPVVVLINVISGLPYSDAAPYAGEASFLGQCSGHAGGAGAELGGVLRLTYGYGSTQRVLEADLQSGSYQLPPVDSVTIDAYLFLNGPAACSVAAAVVPGRHPTPGRLHHSFRSTVPANGTVTEKVPFGARWVSLSGGGATQLGTGPKLALYQGAAGPLIFQDFGGPSFLGSPGQGVELANREDITVANMSNAAADVTVRFFLEA